jgi:hypothetical protein
VVTDLDQLRQKARALHSAGEASLRRGEHAQTVLMLIPDAGEATVMVLPSGSPPTIERARRLVKERSATGLVLSGESWTADVSVG